VKSLVASSPTGRNKWVTSEARTRGLRSLANRRGSTIRGLIPTQVGASRSAAPLGCLLPVTDGASGNGRNGWWKHSQVCRIFSGEAATGNGKERLVEGMAMFRGKHGHTDAATGNGRNGWWKRRTANRMSVAATGSGRNGWWK
jgi:hypothetical protein